MFRILVSALVLGLSPFAHAAFEFSPIISTLAPTGAGATASFTVSNTGDTKIPVQVTIVPREPDEAGKEIYKESEAVSEMFRIFPAQLVLNPKETRSVRVTYTGTPKIKSELAFRVIAEELPVDLSDPNKVYKKAVARVNIAIKYIGSIYVTPAGAKPELAMEAKLHEKPVQKKDAAKELVLMITNKGTSHHVVKKPVLKLQSELDKTEVVLQTAELPTFVNLNILAGKTRKFIIEWPSKLPVGPVKASFEPTKE